MFKYT
ncbi:hypothetical protein GMOD_00010432 [Pyrenophora seminiperda CCB06]